MFERFNNQSRRVVILAQEEARALNHARIGTEHLLLGLLCEGGGAAAKALTSVNVTLDAARQEVETVVARGKQPSPGHIPFTRRAKKSLELSLRECLQLSDDYIGTGHLLLGLIREGDSVAIQVLGGLGVDLNDLGERVRKELHDHPERTDGVRACDDPKQLRIAMRERDEIEGLLDTIDERLSAIERHLGLARTVPDNLRRLDERIAEVRSDKQAAIAVQDFAQAMVLRETEKQLLSERARAERDNDADRGNGAENGKSAGSGESGATGEDPPAAAG